jgi:hypothetical protein
MPVPGYHTNGLLPRPKKPAPAGTMSSPRWDALLLASPGSQIFDGARWWTILHVGPCHIPAHPAPCFVFLLPDPDPEFDGTRLRWHLTDEGWIRHPVVGSGS